MVITQSAYEQAAASLKRFAGEIDTCILEGGITGKDKTTLLHLQEDCRSLAGSMLTAASDAGLAACEEDVNALDDVIRSIDEASQKLADVENALTVAAVVVKLGAAIAAADGTSIIEDLTELQSLGK